MKLTFDKQLCINYTSPSQRTRVLTEGWVSSQVYCPSCGKSNVSKYPNNRPVADFYCSICGEDYELKGKQAGIGTRIVDGGHRTMIERLRSNRNPNLFLLSYDLPTLEVSNFLVIPKHFFTPEMIEKRKPLSAAAERAGWVGCNIVLQSLPSAGKIFLVRNHATQAKQEVLSQWQRTLFLRDEKDGAAKGWTLDVMRCIERLNKSGFVLGEIYAFENELSQRHPKNRHVKEKIRQQLQMLRNNGYLEFAGKGSYRVK